MKTSVIQEKSAGAAGRVEGTELIQPRRKPRTWGILRNVLLNLAALGGAVCIVFVGLAFFFHISLIMFKTGSMTPTIPAGSVALVHQIPVDEVELGDVVTIDRPGELPITHRVIKIEPAAGGLRYLTLRGDANPSPDAAPYLVSQVRRVFWSAPGLAKKIVAVSDRWVMLSISLAVSALVTWAFWPRGAAAVEGRHRVQ
jgi:signal peptidase